MRALETVLALILLAIAMALLARRLRLPPPIMMVIGGLGVALIPGMPRVDLPPELAFTIFVPPLLFRAALTTSLRGLQRDARAVLMLAVGLVLFTTVGTGFIAHRAIPELSWGAALVLGAILSPPDALIGISLARKLGVPRRMISLVEGETLFNDSAAFVIYRQAVEATRSGSFSFALAGPRFLLIALGGIAIGFLTFWIVHTTRKYIADTVIENTIWLFTPFFAFLPAEALGVSGVLAVVVAGVFLRRATPRDVPAATRQQARANYDLLEFVLDGLIFTLIGLQLGMVLRGHGSTPLSTLARDTAIVTAAVIAVRIIWIFPTAFLDRWLSQRARKTTPRAEIRGIALLSWMGVRGGDSLVTALAVPFATYQGVPFPQRDLIIALAFGTILATMLVQGLTMAPLIRWLKLPRDKTFAKEEQVAWAAMKEAEAKELQKLSATAGSKHLLEQVRILREQSLKVEELTLEGKESIEEVRRITLALIGSRRVAAVALRDESVIDDDLLRRIERELDLEELRLPEADRVTVSTPPNPEPKNDDTRRG